MENQNKTGGKKSRFGRSGKGTGTQAYRRNPNHTCRVPSPPFWLGPSLLRARGKPQSGFLGGQKPYSLRGTRTPVYFICPLKSSDWRQCGLMIHTENFSYMSHLGHQRKASVYLSHGYTWTESWERVVWTRSREAAAPCKLCVVLQSCTGRWGYCIQLNKEAGLLQSEKGED